MQFLATTQDRGKRLDVFLTEHLADASRSRIQQWIRDGRVRVDCEVARASLRLSGSEAISVDAAPPVPLKAFAEDIPLEILYEDNDLVAINKPSGMIVHSGAGTKSGTLVNALLHHFSQLSKVAGELRPGIVHRLDRMTSGVLLVAKHDRAHRALARQFQTRQIRKVYCAIVHGCPGESDKHGRRVQADGAWWTRIEMPIRRDRRHRVKMAARTTGRAAQTDFRTLSHSPEYSLLEVRIATGRTHQIRVHLSKIGHPVVGDRLYGAPTAPKGIPKVERFLLHAREIRFRHPATGSEISVEAPLPKDFTKLMRLLEL